MRQTVMPELPEKWASAWRPPVAGATNLVTGIATAYMDSVPVVAITAECDGPPSPDVTGFRRSISPALPCPSPNTILCREECCGYLADTLRRAFFIAQEGLLPGPVLVDIPKDVTAAEYPNVPGREPWPDLSQYGMRQRGRSLRRRRRRSIRVSVPFLYVRGRSCDIKCFGRGERSGS